VTRYDLSAATEVAAAASFAVVQTAHQMVRAVNAWQVRTTSMASQVATDQHIRDAIERLEQRMVAAAAAVARSIEDDV